MPRCVFAVILGLPPLPLFAQVGEGAFDRGEYFAVQSIQQNRQQTDAATTQLKTADLPKDKRDALQSEIKALSAKTDALAAKFPQSGRVQEAAAQQALQARDWARGRGYADKAVELAQGRGEPAGLEAALSTRGLAEWYQGDYPSAARDARAALAIKADDKTAQWVYHASQGRLRAPKAAAADAERDRALDERLAELSPLDSAEVRQAGMLAAGRVEALKRLAEARRLSSVGDYQGALRESEAALAQDPGLPDVYMEKALVLTALRELAKALPEVTKAIALFNARADSRALAPAHALRAQIAGQLGDHAAALADAEKAVGDDGTYAPAYFQRAREREALGRKGAEILADYKKAAELRPRDYAAYYDDAVARLGRPAEAPAAPTPAPQGRGARALLAGAAVLLAALAGSAVWLSRRARRARAAEAPGPRVLGGQYEVVERVGEGGMGEVFKGYDRALKRPVAIKRLRAELQRHPRERERFIHEAELVASLHHPHIVEIYAIARDADATHIVFEYIVGRTVHELLNESPGRHLPPARALELLGQVADAVDHAHSRRVIHRDLKPANIMVADAGWAKVMDFGIARQVQDSLLTTTNTIVGTPTYMAPEQALGAVVKESDVFALGATLYEMLTGAVPFKGPDEIRDKLDGRFLAPSLLLPELPSAIDAVIAKALAPAPDQRYHRCADLYRAAAEALDERVTPVR